MNAVEWLLGCPEPAVVALARRDLLDEHGPTPVDGPWVQALLAGPESESHPYRKWTGAHWRLVSLAELGVPAGEPRAAAARCPCVASSRVSRPAATSRLCRLLRMLDAIPPPSYGAARGSGAGRRGSRRAARASTTGRRAPR
ncbi:MAG TPA: hypothetical protein VGJ63_06000 [Micromonosporaceae bacterium]